MVNDLQDLHFEHNLPGVESWRPPFRLPEAGNFDSLLNDAYLLHLLAIHPERILPPGKSLASAFSDVTNKEAAHGTDALEQQVSRMVKRAFWEEAVSSLSSGSSGTIISRLSQLYKDMHAMLLPILPPTLPIMMTLSRPLSPTSSPLMTGINMTRTVLHGLRERCAPVRDLEIDTLLQEIDLPVSESALPNLLVTTIRSLFQVIEEMTSDFHQFRLSTLGESEMRQLVSLEAQRRERELVLRLYGGFMGVSRPFREWVASLPTPGSDVRPWTSRLISSLSSPSAISVKDPPLTEMPPEVGAFPPSTESPKNILPPIFLLCSPLLFRLQNLLQALVACSCLRLLAFPATSSQDRSYNSIIRSDGAQESPETVFISRIWSLLNGEIDRGGHAEAETKLVNLEDEVVQVARTRASGNGELVPSSQHLSSAEEERIRQRIRRIIRTEDPVFQLLMKRAADAISQHIFTLQGTSSHSNGRHSAAPWHLRTGSRVGNAMDGDSTAVAMDYSIPLPVVKGFEHQILMGALREVAGDVLDCIVWVEEVWEDVLTPGPPNTTDV